MDRVSLDLPVAPIILRFGKYVKVIMVNVHFAEKHGIERGRCVFEDMEQARRERAQKKCPPAIEAKNMKNKFLNGFTEYCKGVLSVGVSARYCYCGKPETITAV